MLCTSRRSRRGRGKANDSIWALSGYLRGHKGYIEFPAVFVAGTVGAIVASLSRPSRRVSLCLVWPIPSAGQPVLPIIAAIKRLASLRRAWGLPSGGIQRSWP